MKIAELPKGAVVRLRNGWLAKTLSDLRTHTPVCEVYGFETESGSVYAADMMQVYVSNETNAPVILAKGGSGENIESRVPGYWMDLEHTEANRRRKGF